MPPLPRGTCPTCSADVALRTGGQLREHRADHGDVAVSPLCPASGLTIAQAQAKIDAELSRLRSLQGSVEPHVDNDGHEVHQ